MKNILKTLILLCFIELWLTGFAYAAGPIMIFSGNGTLSAKYASGNIVRAQVTGTNMSYLPYKQGKGIYPGTGMNISIPIEQFRPEEGTIIFWFRPDWSPGDCTPHRIMEIQAQSSFIISFSKGYSSAIAPDNCYLQAGSAGGSSFEPFNLFTGRTWRYYAIRWSTKQNKIQFVVDGDAGENGEIRSGAFKTDISGPVAASLILNGSAAGAYADVQVFDHYLSIPEIVEAGGLKTVARYLQELVPPPGGETVMPSGNQLFYTYVDPATGQTVTVSGAEKDTESAGIVYDPENMKTLPVIPYTAWAKPMAGRRLRILMVMPVGLYNYDAMLREGVELWRRLDCKCGMTDRLTPEISRNDYDVILLNLKWWNGGWKGWPDIDPQLRAWILERVKSGKSGLVCCYPQSNNGGLSDIFQPGAKISSEILLRGFPGNFMPYVDSSWDKTYGKCYELDDSFYENTQNLAENVIEVYKTGKVRAVKLNYSTVIGDPTMSFTPDTALNVAATDVHYDYWQALLSRAVLFASGRTQTAVIRTVDLKDDTWTINVENAPEKAVLRYRARDAWNRIYAQGETPVRGKKTIIAGKPLPPCTAFDVILKDAGGNVLDWYITSTPPADSVKIKSIAIDRDAYRKGDTISGKVTVAVLPGKERTCVMNAYLADNADRRIVRQEIPCTLKPGSVTIPFSLTIPESSDSLLMRIDILLTQDKRIIDQLSAECSVPKEKFEGFFASMYDGIGFNRFLDRHLTEMFRDGFGMDLGMHKSNISYNLAAKENINTIEYTTHLGYPVDEKTFDVWMEDWDKFFPANLVCDLNEVKKYRPLFYSLGEEHFMLVSGSTNPKATAMFRGYLKDKYGDLGKLNSVWGTNYASWEEVKMLPPEIVDMSKVSFGVQNFESRRFMEKLFADKHAYLAGYIRKVDPLAEVGIHTGWDLWMGRGYDYWLLSKAMDSMMCYGTAQNQYVRSFFKHYYGCNYHYNIGSHEDASWWPWYVLMSGGSGFSWYSISPSEATASDLNLSSDWVASCAEFTSVKEAGDLLARTKYNDDQVAVHYSQDSFQAGVPDMTWIHQRFINLFFDAGIPFKFVSYEQVGGNALVKNKFPLFVLPHSISLSAKEVDAIREYLNQGGVVWADMIPGEYDNYGRKLDQSQVRDLFFNMQRLVPGQNWWVKKIGKGTVIMADPGNYSYDRNTGNDSTARLLLDRIADIADLKRVAVVTDNKTGNYANGIWTAGYSKGGQSYVVVTKDYELADQSTAGVDIDFGTKGHIYEMRSGKYCGFIDKVSADLEPAKGKVFAILPYRLLGINATSGGTIKRGTDLVLKISLGTYGKIGKDDIHLLRVAVTAPDGKEVTSLRRLAAISGGQGEIRFPVAYDDARGTWKVRMKDTATGMTKEFIYRLN